MVDLVELENIHEKLPVKESKWCVLGSHRYYHYKCDGYNDVGWGCGYRTIQTICSWIQRQEEANKDVKQATIPSILDIQRILVDSGDKPSRFHGSREWIGCFEASIVIDTLYNVPCKIVHCEQGGELKLNFIQELFRDGGGPIMMGGDLDAASKGILGYSIDPTPCVLVADPHFSQDSSQSIDAEYLIRNEWVNWRAADSFETNSFYNFCLPQKFINKNKRF